MQRRGVANDPLHFHGMDSLVRYLLRKGEIEEAEEYALKLRDVAQNSPFGPRALALVRSLQGRGDEVLELAREMPLEPTRHDAGYARLWYTAVGAHLVADIERFETAYEEYVSMFEQSEPISIAGIHACIGESDQAFEWIEQAIENFDAASERDQRQLRNDLKQAYLIPLHDDPRWEDLMEGLDVE